jgi:predicted acetyltransferase
MALRVRAVRDLHEQAAALSAIGHYSGWAPTVEDAERFSSLLPVDRMHAVLDGGDIVAGAGAFPFGLTVPGGALPCAGVTVVGVLPSHRRRGLLRRMMDVQLRDVRERGEQIAALWASEETIYPRFGYGLAALSHNIDAERGSVAIRSELPRDGSMRLVTHDEALRTFPRLYERVARSRPGMIVRTRDWWSVRRLDDRPEVRRGGGPLVRALLERDGRPVGYTIYRLVQEGSTPETWTKTVRVVEAVGVDDAATRDVWRFLLQIDWTDRVAAYQLPVDHPLPLLVDRINKLRLSVWDALWLRVIDVPAALAGRTYASTGPVTVEVASDPHFPENVGTWTVDGREVRRARRRPDVVVAVDGLGSAFLGGMSFGQLARAGRAEEGARGGIERADAAFRASAAPWCVEIF